MEDYLDSIADREEDQMEWRDSSEDMGERGVDMDLTGNRVKVSVKSARK